MSANAGLKVAARLSPAGLDQHDIKLGETVGHVADSGAIRRSVFADGGMGASGSLDAHDALRRQGASVGKDFRILLLTDVVRDDGDIIAVALAGYDKRRGAAERQQPVLDRKSVGSGKSVSVRVDLGGRRIIKKKKTNTT